LNRNREPAGIQFQVAYSAVVIHIYTAELSRGLPPAEIRSQSSNLLRSTIPQSHTYRQQSWREDSERPKETLHPPERRSRVSNLRRSNATGSDRNKSSYRYKSPGRQCKR